MKISSRVFHLTLVIDGQSRFPVLTRWKRWVCTFLPVVLCIVWTIIFITFEIHYQTSNTSDLLDRFEQRATQSKLEQFSWNTHSYFYLHTYKLYFKDVSAGYSQNELLFAYKGLMEHRNGSNSMNSGDADGRRNVTNAENTKRPSFGNEICKWIHRNKNNSQATALPNRITIVFCQSSLKL